MKNHESALLVVLSYIIGFTTAFIMFVMVDSGKEVMIVDDLSPALSDSEVIPTVEAQLMETSEGLFMRQNGQERIISAFTEEAEAQLGFYTDIAVSSVSPNGQYAHYCAVMSAEAEVCQNFVYSVPEDATYMVKDSVGQIETPNTEATEWTWSEDSALRFGDRVTSQDSRWVMN